MKAYKITGKNMQCHGYQYILGNVHKFDGKIDICKSGFHASKNPMDAMRYHDLYESRFFVVDCRGDIIEQEDKLVCSEIEILSELTLKEWIDSCYDSLCSGEGCEDVEHVPGYYSRQAASGDYSSQAASGYYSRQAASGDYSSHELYGENSVAAALGIKSKVRLDSDTSWLVLVDRCSEGIIRRVVAKKPGQKIDGITIKTKHWYWFEDGKLMEEEA